MDGDSSWSARLSSASRRYQSALQSRSDMFMGFDENDGDDDIREEFLCPFCSEYFDIVGLCCHIDEEHPMEARNGRKRKSRKGGSYSTLSLLRKELREGNLQSLFGGSSCIVSSSNADPLLSSFILPLANEHASSQPHLHTETRSSKKCSDETALRAGEHLCCVMDSGGCSPDWRMQFYVSPYAHTRSMLDELRRCFLKKSVRE
ncbi:hypothetical protein JHK84_057192 [Glycine max]|nr:hypothetical protein JHK84_057192 [Glycine max]